MKKMALHGLLQFPMVLEGDDLPDLILNCLKKNEYRVGEGDVFVLAQKIVSKAEGRQVLLDSVDVSEEAKTLAATTEKDPRLVQLVLDESEEVLRARPGILIVRHKLGLVGAHAGIDQSNIDATKGESALLLPVNPDESAKKVKSALELKYKKNVAVIIADSMNRPWRLGTTGQAIGSAGLKVLDDRRGMQDIYGRELKVTLSNSADALAAFATFAMGETIEKTPLVIISGADCLGDGQRAIDIVRPKSEDLFC